MSIKVWRTIFWGRWLTGLLFIFLFMGQGAQATHLRAGNIYAKSDTTANRNPLRFFFTLITYSVNGGIEDDNATLYFGDCTSQTVPRASEVVLQNGLGNTSVNTYYFEHTYAGARTFTVTFVGENRNGGIVNMQNSVQQTFLLQTTVTIDPVLGINRSPILSYPPVDLAARGQVFVHNPGAYDPDGDSLSFKMYEPKVDAGRDACGNPLPRTVPGYSGLENYLGPANGPLAGFSLNPRNGQLTWNTPSIVGEFNIAFIVEEWRNGRLIGTVVRDMQIQVLESKNRPPRLIIPRDTCVVAGTLLRDTIRVTDPDRNPVVVTAISRILPPATFRKVLNDTTFVFEWNTTCQNVQSSPYSVLFRAEDRPPAGLIPLVDLQPWQITVVGPPPVLKSALAQTSSSIRLDWEPYVCTNAEKFFIYRKEGPSTFVPTTCEVGIPASAGYTLVGEVTAGTNFFIDNNKGQGLARNKEYCYRIYAQFPHPGGGKSIASNEVCATLESIALTKVSVTNTSATAGKMRVEWSKPRNESLTTLVAPFQYRLYRAPGQSRAASTTFTEVAKFSSLDETSFEDNNLNTLDNAYTYKLELYHSGTVGSPTILVDSTSASSVRLNALAQRTELVLNWTYNVPWSNVSTSAKPLYHVIFLKRPNEEFVRYDSVLVTAQSGAFRKVIPLEVGQEYCAYVMTRGTYNVSRLPEPLENNSQIACVVNVCKPVLTIDPCNEPLAPTDPPFSNVLTWEIPPTCDASKIAYFTLYYKATDEAPFEVIAQQIPGNTFTYTHQNLPSYAGCYAITATDVSGNTSVYDPADPTDPSVICKENCINFILPNIFTPNNDGYNDVFTPKQGAAFIRTAKLVVYNRWGNKVFEGNQEPGLKWAGVDNGGKALPDGTYFYQVEVEFYGRSSTPDRRIVKGWVEIVH
ncbi:gliding motility-associated C-terminal domain-containing protein [Rufibacter ruber]|uniref:T9SS type B sorting domain-containing protein n=1 Tax=Rufibacter ruber TaxID=1783499 RepID=UPI000833FDFE|nr:gliding motility-associated C-terminal domain-containing protein [Rufibacter ruber]